MGNARSKNIVDSTVESYINVINEVTQQCVVPINQKQETNISGNRGSIVDIGKIGGKQHVSLDFTCFNDAKVIEEIDRKITNEADQVAKATTQALNLDPGSKKAKNVATLTTTLGTSIVNAYADTCAQTVSQAQLVNIQNNDGSIVRVGDINFEQTFDGIVQCIQNVESVSSVKEELEQTIDQEAEAKTSSFMIGLIIFGIVIVVLIVGLIIFFVFRTLTAPVRRAQETVSKVVTAGPETLRELLTNPEFAKTAGSVTEALGGAEGIAKLAATLA